MQATKDMTIQSVIEMNQGTADILMSSGMHCLGCAMAHGETIEQACQVHGVDADELIDKINEHLGEK